MNFPVTIEISSAEISLHTLFELLAYTIGFRYFLALRKKQGDKIVSKHRLVLFIAAALGALISSRLIGFFETEQFYKGEFSISTFYGSKTILGGLIGGLIFVEITKKVIGVEISSGDLMTYPLVLAMMIGRLGCFFGGLEDGTYGKPSDLPWAMDFGDNMYRHPTNLYEIIFLAVVWVVIVTIERRFVLADGSRFKIFLFAYCVFRLFIEFIKPVNTFSIGLSAIQLTALAGIIYYYKIIFRPKSLFVQPEYA